MTFRLKDRRWRQGRTSATSPPPGDMFVGLAIFGKPDYKAVIDQDAGGAGPCPLNVPSIWCCSIRDGTLIDSASQLALAVNRTLTDLGLPRPMRPWCAPGSAMVPTS